LLLGGGGLLASLGLTTALVTLGLVLCIVAYDLVHKRTALAPLLMAGCRFLLYLVAGSAATGGISAKLLWCAGALAAYIVGLSFIARKEAQNVKPNLLVLPLFIAPLITSHLHVAPENKVVLGLIGAGYLGWVVWSWRHMIKGGAPAIGRTVSALLAGIVLVDMLAVQGGGGMMPLAFLALFAGALILQRTIPAT
jgi:4-hydroxybenzoate polyprenyltransferase